MRLRAHQIGELAEGVALLTLESLETRAVMTDLVRRQAIHREEETITMVLRDLRR